MMNPTETPTPTPTTTPANPAPQAIDKKTFWTGILTLSAAVLLAAHVMQPAQTSLLPAAMGASVQESVENRNYAMVTATTADGGEALYVLDKRSGNLGLFAWHAESQMPRLVNARPVTQAFAQ